MIATDKNDREKKRVCAYARVSTSHEKQGNSLDNQVKTYENMIRSNPEYEFAGVYSDFGITGKFDKRPGFQNLMQDARAGKIDMIITKSISRFARNTVVLLEYVRELKDLGIGVLFEENNIYSLSSEGEMMLTVLASFAQEESRSMGENIRWSRRRMFERGEVMINTKRFLGYDKDRDGNLVINEDEAEIVRRIYDLYLSGLGAHRISKILNGEGIPTVTGSKWCEDTVSGILKNEKYKGDCILQKTYRPEYSSSPRLNTGQLKRYYVSEDHEPIVSREDWEAVQELMSYNRQKRSISKDGRYQNRYPNSGMLKCPYCGKSLRRHIAYNKRVVWACKTYLTEGKAACKGIQINDVDLEGRIFTEPTVVEEVMIDGQKYYRYTGQEDYNNGIRADIAEEKAGSRVLPSVNRSRRAVIKL